MVNLQELFENIPQPKLTEGNESLFSAVPLQEDNPHRVGKDVNGLPIVLIAANYAISNQNLAPIVLDNIRVLYYVTCRIQKLDGGIEEGQFTVVHCISHEKILHTFFLHVMGAILASFAALPTPSEVSNAIRSFIELFRSLTKPPKESLQGLWAELYLIARSKKPFILIEAWRVNPEATFDFTSENQYLEVKSTSGSIRQHYFSLDQLQTLDGIDILIASIFVERSQAGKSIWDLLLQIRAKCADRLDLMLRLDEVVSSTLGENWRQIMDERYNEKLAKQSFQVYKASDIPSVSQILPPEVSNVRFLSNLSHTSPIDITAYRTKGGIFRWLL